MQRKRYFERYMLVPAAKAALGFRHFPRLHLATLASLCHPCRLNLKSWGPLTSTSPSIDFLTSGAKRTKLSRLSLHPRLLLDLCLFSSSRDPQLQLGFPAFGRLCSGCSNTATSFDKLEHPGFFIRPDSPELDLRSIRASTPQGTAPCRSHNEVLDLREHLLLRGASISSLQPSRTCTLRSDSFPVSLENSPSTARASPRVIESRLISGRRCSPLISNLLVARPPRINESEG
jgi:hypothetical protein